MSATATGRGRTDRPSRSRPARALPPTCVEVLVHVRLAPATHPTEFEDYLRGVPGVLHVWRTAGDIDFEVHLVCDGVNDLHALLTRARREGGAQETTTHLILKPADPAPTADAVHHRKVRP
jgi:DNA-binding Lrp family transcriptional regulator